MINFFNKIFNFSIMENPASLIKKKVAAWKDSQRWLYRIWPREKKEPDLICSVVEVAMRFMPFLILLFSLAAQLTAAVLAIRLARITDQAKLWAPLAAAFGLMALGGCYTLYEWLRGRSPAFSLDVTTELTALGIATFTVVAIILLTPLLWSAQRSLRRLKNEHESILTSAGEGIFGMNREGKLIFLNPAAMKITGYNQEDLMGKNIHRIIHHTRPDGTPHPQDQCPAYLTLQNGEAHYAAEELLWNKAGKSFPVEYVATPIKEEGRTVGVVVVFKDITARKQAEEERSRLAAIVASSDDAIISATLDGVITSWNPGAEKIFGYPAEEARGQPISILVQTDKSDRVTQILEQIKRGEPTQRFETFCLRKNSEPIYVSLSVFPLRDEAGRIVGASTIVRDISDRKRAEEKIQRLNEELEQRVRERTAELEFSNRELEAFTYSVSHDLKTPVRTIEGFSRMLMTEHAAELDAETRRLLQVIRTNTKLMLHLIDDLLALSRVARLPIKKSDINMSAMTKKVFDQLQAQTPERDLRLTVGDLPPGLGDQSLLHQVMLNLLANAIKYTKPRKTAVIEVGGKDGENETIYYVKDNGIGFDERYADKLFGVFQRLHGGTEYEGTGVGLAIVKRIILRHGGRVWAEGKVDEGAAFYFALPKNEDRVSASDTQSAF